jgi:hypothetical protein
MKRSVPNKSALIIGLAAPLLLLASCGTPSKLYSVDKADGVYFTAPQGWHEISQDSINAVEAKSQAAGAADRLALVHWQIGYSLDKNFKAEEILSLKAPEKPVVYVRVRSMSSDEMNAVSYNTLRDLVVPLTSWASGSDSSAPPLSISDDSEIVQKGGRGVHTQFTFKATDGIEQTIDQSALMSNDRSTLYIMIVRCSKSCFDSNRKVLEKIVTSFTVRGKK